MRILIAIDRSEYGEIVLEHGLDQAARHPGAELHFVTAVDEDADIAPVRAWLASVVREGCDTFHVAAPPPSLHVLRGRPIPVIAALASDLRVDLLVFGRFGTPSVADTLLQIVEVPTLVVGIAGTVLEPQCPACVVVRRESAGERLFCDAHASDYLPDLTSRLVPLASSGSRIW